MKLFTENDRLKFDWISWKTQQNFWSADVAPIGWLVNENIQNDFLISEKHFLNRLFIGKFLVRKRTTFCFGFLALKITA